MGEPQDTPFTPTVSLVSERALSLQATAVLFAAASAACHTRLHTISLLALYLALTLGGLALLRLFNRAAPSLPYPLRCPLHWLHAMVFEVLALLLVFALRFTHSSLRLGPSGGRPLLLIHGYCNRSTAWTFFRRRLAKSGLGPLYVIDLGHPFRSIREYAKKVEAKVAEIRAETGRDDLTLVGHSMGGVVAAWYTTQLRASSAPLDVVTLASPLKGTRMAYLGIGPNAKELRPSSPLLKELQSAMETAEHTRFFHLGTKTDELVIPWSSSMLGKHPERELLFEDLGHASFLFSTRAVRQVVSWIGQ